MAVKSNTPESGTRKTLISSQNSPLSFIFKKNHLQKVATLKNPENKAEKLEILIPQVLASKKEFKTAVARNKARRSILEAYIAVIREGIGQNSPKNAKIGDKNNPSFKIHAKIGVLDSDFETLKKIIKNQIDRM